MSKNEDKTEDAATQYEVMPGADTNEEVFEQLDLSFSDVEELAQESVEEEEELTQESVEEDTLEAEVEGEDSQEAEEAEEEEIEAPKASKKATMVPKARLDEVLSKQKALQKQLDDIHEANQKSAEAPEDYDFDSKEVEYQNMVLDGETEKAVGLRREIRKAERSQLEYEMRQEMSQTVQQDRQATALQIAATAMEQAYPEFDSRSEQFDEAMTSDVVELRDAFIMKGYDPVGALEKAVRYVVKDNDLVESGQSAPSLAGAKPKVDELAKKRAQVSRKLRAAEAQPPELPGESSSSHGEKGLDLNSLSEEEFDALPEATLRRLRGDIM